VLTIASGPFGAPTPVLAQWQGDGQPLVDLLLQVPFRSSRRVAETLQSARESNVHHRSAPRRGLGGKSSSTSTALWRLGSEGPAGPYVSYFNRMTISVAPYKVNHPDPSST